MKSKYLVAAVGLLCAGSACAGMVPYKIQTAPQVTCQTSPESFGALCQKLNVLPVVGGQAGILDSNSRTFFNSLSVVIPFAGMNAGHSSQCFEIDPTTLTVGNPEPVYYCNKYNNSAAVSFNATYSNDLLKIQNGTVTVHLLQTQSMPAITMHMQLVNGVLVPLA